LDVQYSLLKVNRSCAAAELTIAIRPLVFCNSGTAKLRNAVTVSALDHRGSTIIIAGSLNEIVRPANVHFDHFPPLGRVLARES
jgi:hypothetical protein